jgi:hypothetical protein
LPSVSNPMVPLIDYTDNSSPILSGKIGLRASDTEAQFDQVIVMPIQSVTSISVVADDGVNQININDGTLRMRADIKPYEASNHRITWSVINGTGND